MPLSKRYKIIDFWKQHEQQLFYVVGFCSLAIALTGIYIEKSWLFILPLAALVMAFSFIRLRALFYVMLMVLPISIETAIGSYGTDLPSEPLVLLLSFCTVFYIAKQPSILTHQKFKHTIIFLLGCLFLWSVISTIYSSNVFLSIKYVLAKSWYILGFFVFPLLILNTTKKIISMFWCLFIPTFLSVLYILIAHAYHGFSFDSITNVVHPIYRNHVNYAVFITMLLPFIFWAKTQYLKNSIAYVVLKYAIVIFLIAIYFSYTRGAWVAVVAMLFYWMALKLNSSKYIVAFGIIGAIFLTTYILQDNRYLKYAPNYDTTIYHGDLSEHLTSTFEMEDMSTVERFYRWIAAVHLFKTHPLVGVGPNNFVAEYKKHTVTAYETYISENEERSTVHNYFLLLLTEQGLPAMLLFLALIVAVLFTAQRLYNQTSVEKRWLVLAITLSLITFLFNNTLSDLVEANKVGSLFYICLALLINVEMDFNEQQK